MTRTTAALAGLILTTALGAAGSRLLRATPQDERRTWESRDGQGYVRIPEFVWKALVSPSAKKANLWIGNDGEILRYSVQVGREQLPEWVPAVADARLGKGEDLGYEVELYPDGSQVFELYRKVDGLERQLSVKADRSVYYLGTELAPDCVPEAVASALRGVQGLQVGTCLFKEGPEVAEYHVQGTRDGLPCRVRVSKAGKLVAVQRKLAAELELPLR